MEKLQIVEHSGDSGHDIYNAIFSNNDRTFSFRIYYDHFQHKYLPYITNDNSFMKLYERHDFTLDRLSYSSVLTNSVRVKNWIKIVANPHRVDMFGDNLLDNHFYRYSVLTNDIIPHDYHSLYKLQNIELFSMFSKIENVIMVYDHLEDKLYLVHLG